MPSIETAVLRIINAQGEAVGTGFLVSPTLGVTCAHVVEDVQSRPGESLQLTQGQAGPVLTAQVLEEGYSSPKEHDLAFLRLDSPPPGSAWLNLSSDTRDCAGRAFTSFGYAPLAGIPERRATGSLGGRVEWNGIPLLQLEGAKFEQGMSGAAVQDQASGYVLGMFSMFPRQLKQDFGYATPAETIAARWPASEPRPYFSDLYGSLGRAGTGYLPGLKKYLDYYLGSAETPVPFGGRRAQMDKLDAWLNDPRAPAYGLLAGQAGRGKSALLANWAQELIEHRQGRVILIPISVRFNIHSPDVVFRALAVRLAELQGVSAGLEGLNTYAQALEKCSTWLGQAPPPGLPVVVILDGLDELGSAAAALRTLFPPALPAGFKVLVSARYLSGDVDEQGWVQRLDWRRKARSFYLPLLKRDGLAEVLDRIGEPLASLTEDLPGLAAQLFRLTLGDPLLLRLYLDELLATAEEALQQGESPRLEPEALPSIKSGLKGFFKNWWDEQQDLWKQSGADPLTAQDVLAFLNLCATAHGPLSAEEVAAVAPGSGLTSGLRLQQVAAVAGRFIIGEGSREAGYVFSHPRLGDFFSEGMLPEERQRWQQNFLRLGRETLQALVAGRLRPQDALPYAVRYFSLHLEDAGAPPESFYALLCKPWLDAWEAAVGKTEGFLLDTELAWKRAEADPAALGVQARAALINASLTSLGSIIPTGLLVEAVRKGALGPLQGYLYARRKGDLPRRVNALAYLYPCLPEDLQQDALTQALEYTRALLAKWNDYWSETSYINVTFQALAPLLSSEQAGELWDLAILTVDLDNGAPVLAILAGRLNPRQVIQALEQARNMDQPGARARVTGALAGVQGLEEGLRQALAIEALAITRSINSSESGIYPLEQLVPPLLEQLVSLLPPDRLAEALELALEGQAGVERGAALAALAGRLPPELLEKAFKAVIGDHLQSAGQEELPVLLPYLSAVQVRQAWVAASSLDAPRVRAELGNLLLPYLPAEELAAASETVWQAALDTPGEENRAETLLAVADRQPAEHQALALAGAGQISSLDERAGYLVELAVALPAGPAAEPAVEAALEAIWQHDLPLVRAYLLAQLAPHLSPARLAQALEQAEQSDFMGGDEIAALVPSLPPDLLAQALEGVARMQGRSGLPQALESLAAYLPADLLPPALAAARHIADEQVQVEALLAYLPGLPEELLPGLLDAARRYPPAQAAFLLEGLGPLLPSRLLPEAIAAARQVGDPGYRGRALGSLAIFLPEPEAAALQGEALELILGLTDGGISYLYSLRHCLLPALAERVVLLAEALPEKDRAAMLVAIAPVLTPLLAARALKFAARFESSVKADLLVDLGPRLPPEDLPEALELGRAIPEWHLRARALAGLAARLEPGLRRAACAEALLAIGGDKSSREQAFVLELLAPSLPDDLVEQAVALARQHVALEDRAPALAALGRRLGGPGGVALQEEALDALQRIAPDDIFGPSQTLRDMAAYLMPDLLPAAVQVARHTSDYSQAGLASLVKFLPEDLLAQAWVLPLSPRLLAALAQRWGELARGLGRSELELFTQALQEFKSLQRRDVLEVLAALAPVIRRLGGAQAQVETVQSILDVTEWWP